MRRALALVLLLAPSIASCELNAGSSRADLPAVSLPFTPPPVRGGTITVRADGRSVVVVDRDRAEVHVIELAAHDVVGATRFGFTKDAFPERSVYVDATPVVLLSDGRIARLDGHAPSDPTCASPRGLAWDPARDRLWVSCADGELVGVPMRDRSAPVTRHWLSPDLGDIVVVGDLLAIAEVRNAHVLYVRASDGVRVSRSQMLATATWSDVIARHDVPQAALRLLAMPDGGVLVLHERMRVGADIAPSWGGGSIPGPCGTAGIQVSTSISRPGLPTINGPVVSGVPYASDLAYSASRQQLAVADPSALDPEHGGPPAVTVPLDQHDIGGRTPYCPPVSAAPVQGQATAVAYLPDGTLLVQTREPASLYIDNREIPLSDDSVRDTGHDIFHTNTVEGSPCIACHLDGASDGHVWNLGNGPRCTQTLRGGLTSTAPFHWDGSFPTMGELLASHFPGAEGGQRRDDQVVAFARWVDALPPDPHPTIEPRLAQEGAALFTSLGCAQCHGADAQSPLARSVDLGTGDFQIPSLVDLTAQSPLGHDGCARSLDELLSGACGWSEHRVSDPAERDALAAFLGVRR